MSITFSPARNQFYCRDNKLVTTIVHKDEVLGDFEERIYPYELNVANGNAVSILSWLGIEFDYCGEVSPDAVLAAIRELPDPWLLQRKGSISKQPGRCTVIDCGRSEDAARHYTENLREIAVEAKRRGVMIEWS